MKITISTTRDAASSSREGLSKNVKFHFSKKSLNQRILCWKAEYCKYLRPKFSQYSSDLETKDIIKITTVKSASCEQGRAFLKMERNLILPNVSGAFRVKVTGEDKLHQPWQQCQLSRSVSRSTMTSTLEITGDDVLKKKMGRFPPPEFFLSLLDSSAKWDLGYPAPFTGKISLWLIRWVPFGIKLSHTLATTTSQSDSPSTAVMKLVSWQHRISYIAFLTF